MTNIGVYLSSKTDVAPEIKDATEAFGQWLGQTHKTLVYGGSRCGMMEVLASAVKKKRWPRIRCRATIHCGA